MLVEDVMQRDVITVTPETTLPEALRLARGRGVRHLPVMDGPELVGIVSDRDLKRAMASPATSLERHELHYLLEKVAMEEIMTRAVITVGPMLPVEEAARLMLTEKVSALPVTEHGKVVGIVTLPARTGRKEVVIRVRTINPGPAIKRLEARGYAVRNPWRG